VNALRVPEVVAVGENFLLLEWLERGNASDQSETRLGEGLAALHQHTAPTYGLDHLNFIGSLPQINTPKTTWAEFYGECRIRPQMDIARRNGELSPVLENLLNSVIAKLPDHLPETRPSLLHGDLWRGNVMTLANGQPAVIDPAVYYGNPEVELAFTELFGGFSARFYTAYGKLDAGYPERKNLYQLYPLMVHMNLFGGGYTSQVHSVARRYA
jgi:protein-ribulosamine 3-kinase